MVSFNLQLQIWDTAGQERFRTITQSYYRSANGVILTYDITQIDSYNNIGRWLEDVKKYAGKCIVQMLIGNKTDLDNCREVPRDEPRKFANHHQIDEVLETSAKVIIPVYYFCGMESYRACFAFVS